MENFTPFSALLGGACIGGSAALLLLLNGRIAGISGIFHQVVRPTSETGWRLAFLAGMIAGGSAWFWLVPNPLSARPEFPLWALILAGLLVGYGTRLGSGCTSGHGICGIGRLSGRSIIATATFLVTGVASAMASRHLLGVGL